jgi:hypothetical protein
MRVKHLRYVTVYGSHQQRERKTAGLSRKWWKKKLSEQTGGLSSQNVSQAELLRQPGLAHRQTTTPIKKNKKPSESAGRKNYGNMKSSLTKSSPMKGFKKLPIELLHDKWS